MSSRSLLVALFLGVVALVAAISVLSRGAVSVDGAAVEGARIERVDPDARAMDLELTGSPLEEVREPTASARVSASTEQDPGTAGLDPLDFCPSSHGVVVLRMVDEADRPQRGITMLASGEAQPLYFGPKSRGRILTGKSGDVVLYGIAGKGLRVQVIGLQGEPAGAYDFEVPEARVAVERNITYRTPPPTGTVKVIVQSMTTRGPVEGATVRLLLRDGTERLGVDEAVSGADGVAVLPRYPSSWVLVTHPEFVERRSELEEGRGELEHLSVIRPFGRIEGVMDITGRPERAEPIQPFFGGLSADSVNWRSKAAKPDDRVELIRQGEVLHTVRIDKNGKWTIPNVVIPEATDILGGLEVRAVLLEWSKTLRSGMGLRPGQVLEVHDSFVMPPRGSEGSGSGGWVEDEAARERREQREAAAIRAQQFSDGSNPFEAYGGTRQ